MNSPIFRNIAGHALEAMLPESLRDLKKVSDAYKLSF